MSRLLAGLLIGLAATAGIYGLAATTATTVAITFDAVETTRHARIVELSATVRRAWLAHRSARAKCARLAPMERTACKDEAKAAEILAVRDARRP